MNPYIETALAAAREYQAQVKVLKERFLILQTALSGFENLETQTGSKLSVMSEEAECFLIHHDGNPRSSAVMWGNFLHDGGWHRNNCLISVEPGIYRCRYYFFDDIRNEVVLSEDLNESEIHQCMDWLASKLAPFLKIDI
uniref:Uncharacterized protein n=1 Tax=Cyanothece sp. (strain PCC 7425 / ATCC 29141) TaxID=395961 RepID=B8HQV2_CYAP4